MTTMNRLLSAVLILLPSIARADEPKNLLKAVNKADSWRLEMTQGGKGAIEAADDEITFKVTKTTGTNWHVQAFQVDLDLKQGKEYTVKVKMRAPERRSVLLVAMIDKEDWHEIGLHEDISLGKEFTTHEFTFKAKDVAEKKNRIGLVLGGETGDVVVKELTLVEKK